MFHRLIITMDFIPEYNCCITQSTGLERAQKSTSTILSLVSLCLQGFRHPWAFAIRRFQSIFHTLGCLSFITCWIPLERISAGLSCAAFVGALHINVLLSHRWRERDFHSRFTQKVWHEGWRGPSTGGRTLIIKTLFAKILTAKVWWRCKFQHGWGWGHCGML